MKFRRFDLFFLYFGLSLANNEENLQEIYIDGNFFNTDLSEFSYKIMKFKRETLSTKNVFPTCRIDDIPLPRNAKKWSCDKVISEFNIVPKNTKCRLLCQDGYEVTNCTYFFTFDFCHNQCKHKNLSGKT